MIFENTIWQTLLIATEPNGLATWSVSQYELSWPLNRRLYFVRGKKIDLMFECSRTEKFTLTAVMKTTFHFTLSNALERVKWRLK